MLIWGFGIIKMACQKKVWQNLYNEYTKKIGINKSYN